MSDGADQTSGGEHGAPWSLGGKRLVLTVTTGRSGTAYLAHVLAGARDVCALHEPMPKFAEVMRAVQCDPAVAAAFWLERKLPFIRATAEAAYLETAHLACKGFIEPLIAHGLVPALIHLWRDPYAVASSMCAVNCIPARTPFGLRFTLSPDDPNVLRLPEWRGLADWELCYWYCLEIERRAQVYGDLVSRHGGTMLKTSLTELKTESGLRTVLGFLGLCAEEDFQRAAARASAVVNDKNKAKLRFARALPSEAEMRDMAARVDAAVKTAG